MHELLFLKRHEFFVYYIKEERIFSLLLNLFPEFVSIFENILKHSKYCLKRRTDSNYNYNYEVFWEKIKIVLVVH